MAGILAVTGPVYLLIAAGYLATRAGWFERAEMRVFGRYVVQLALPALLFNALAQRRVLEVLNPTFIAVYAGGSLLAMGLGLLWARRVARQSVSGAAVLAMGMSCSNSGFIGFPLVAQVFGAADAGVGLALAMVVENLLLLPLVLAIADSGLSDAEAGQGRLQRWRAAFAQSLRAVLRNPMIHGIAAGFLTSLAGLQLPAPLVRAIDLLALSCAALSLFVIGGSLVGLRLRGMLRDVAAVAAGKLLLHPLLVLGLVLLAPPMRHELQLAVVMFAATPMLGIYPILAQKHGHDALAAAAQLGTTAASFFSLTALLWAIQHWR